MKRILSLMVVMVLVGLPAFAQKDENNRIKNAGKVMVEILNVPDDIPEDLLDKAECVIVLPSVIKFAIGFGGSYGREVMTCRSGKEFSGPWSAPSMMALEGGSFGLQLGGQATDFVLLVMNQRGASSILTSQVKLGGDLAAAAGPKGRSAAALKPQQMSPCGRKFCRIRVRADCSPGFLWRAPLSAPTTTATRGSMEKGSRRRTS
jgi:SH3 domain-containing YSC84-like protein 1